ncbi:isoaspartyl peptidase/L-asparaginase-like isoform X1 [Lethenteron reissneri]|uniref:isoaspartyl peptidase/L-asparaginase-like isoform X1 n=1 Tax=Lethenteron reissneri TaxID=7753 RepID=UPI002AB78486|nr:isoaspartyl peptidase/L-asparaginase-like isoform X1 [Lethenteron reissneri]XP_061424859.1 isoaspartyl peptidase/L-asparaginase-like isoform X1 [Lethenteron reissneri]XP_061424860.1 isoaspartyl peptidase/L-asparaginase-like isoform X1 [Lethenteron reissneri]
MQAPPKESGRDENSQVTEKMTDDDDDNDETRRRRNPGLSVVVVHGGAWAIPDDLAEASVAGVKGAAMRAHELLSRGGGSALDAVEAAVKALEDDAAFDAGHGSVLTEAGEVEMDALMMDGRTLRLGSVSCVQGVANPVSLARAVMEKTEHAMLTAAGAARFAEALGVARVPQRELVTEAARSEWERYRRYRHAVRALFSSERAHDTVGAVALDARGDVACATSTGGITNKMPGRVGDSPIVDDGLKVHGSEWRPNIGRKIVQDGRRSASESARCGDRLCSKGCGGYADNAVGAVSTTGHGESIMKVTLARLILFHMEAGKSPDEATALALSHMRDRVGGHGGAVVLGRDGRWGARCSTERMAWAAVAAGSLYYGLQPGEVHIEPL